MKWKIKQIKALPHRIVGYCLFFQLKSCSMKSNSIPACSCAKATNVPQSARSCEKLTRPCNPFCQRDSLNPWQKVVILLFLNTWTSWNGVKSQETTFLWNVSAVKPTILKYFGWKTFSPGCLQMFCMPFKFLIILMKN